MNRLFITTTALLLSAVVFCFSQDKKDTAAQIKFADAKYNFGFVREGELVHMEFKFENTGTEPLVIKEVKVTCGCTGVDFPKTPVKPGGKGIIKVNFDTNGKLDRQDRTVDVISNAAGSPHKLRFKGVVLKKK